MAKAAAQYRGEKSLFLVAVTPRGEHNSNDMSLPTAGSFPELAAARLPPTSEEASWGQLSPQGHGWVSLSLCKTTVFGSSSTKNWEKKKKKKHPHPFLPSGELVDTSQNVCAICTQLWSRDAAVSPSVRCAACQSLALGWAAETGTVSRREA